MSDLDLLQEFAREHSQDAFTTLVQRHLDLVYCAALRQVRSPELAEEVTQSVFFDLARGVQRLKPGTILTAWLYDVTRRTAINVVRGEARRRVRERVATELNTMNSAAVDWKQIEPLLDEAMHALDSTDRAAVLLRFFENKSLREVGEALGTSDDAAQKRVSRAVERLREFFVRRGVALGTATLVAALASNAVHAAPVGLASTIAGAAAVGTSIASSTTLTVLKAIAMTKLQKILIAAGLAALIAIPVVYQSRSPKMGQLARTDWKDAGQRTPEAAFETYFWAGREGNLTRSMEAITAPQTPPGSPEEASSNLQKAFSQLIAVRVQPFAYETKDSGWFEADWLLQSGKTKHTRSKWRRIDDKWKLVNDEPVPAVAQK